MSNKLEALQFLNAAAAPVKTVDVYNSLTECDTASGCVVMMSTLKSEGLIEIAGKDGKQNLWRITDAGRALLDGHKALGGGKPARAVKPRKKKAAPMRKPPKAKRKYTRHVKKPAARRAVPVVASRWAITDDGAFVDLVSELEIDVARARALVAFIRKLDEAAA